MGMFNKIDTDNCDVSVMESYGVTGAAIAVQEGYEDMMGIIEAMHCYEMAEIEEVRQVSLLEAQGASSSKIASVRSKLEAVKEGAVSDAWTRIKEFFKKLWGKLKGYFASVVRVLDGMLKSGKEFAKKYEKQLYKLELSGFEYKMFVYSKDKCDSETALAATFTKLSEKVDSEFASVISDAEKATESNKQDVLDDIKKISEGKEKFEDGLRGAVLGAGTVDSSDFAEKLFENFRNGASKDDKDDVKVDIGTIVNYLKDDKSLRCLKKSEEAMDKSFKDIIKEIDKASKDATSAATDSTKSAKAVSNTLLIQIYNKKSSYMSTAHTIATSYVSAWRSAIQERQQTYKSVCLAAFRYKEND